VAGWADSSSDSASVRTAATSAAQRVLVRGVDSQVQAGAEQAAFAAGDPVGQLPRVLGGGLGVGVIQAAPLEAGAAARFEAGTLLAELRGGDRRRHRLDVQAHVQPPGVAGERFQPSGRDLGGVAGHHERGRVPVADPQVPGGDLDAVRAGYPAAGWLPGSSA